MSLPDFPKKHVSGVLIHPYFYERKEIEEWKLEHERIDAERDKELREFFEWLDLTLPESTECWCKKYEEKKKSVLGK